ncbi:MAG TPA: carbamoyl-phosphate synthase large subunit [Thermoleophilia bacterium]|nr:carbamoyl-phosphate synthase large subunit [Thermoleophilia bacterium]
MPRRDDLKKILIIGSGPIVIGQACEFDYSGTQACRVLLEDGFEVVLVNSNPATIMTDPDFATRTYVEPLDLPTLTRIIEIERPDALLPTLGGQTALNLSIELAEAGVLDLWSVEMIGADAAAIRRAEDRAEFRATMESIGLRVPRSALAHTLEEAELAVAELGLPLVVRPAFTLGGIGGGVAHDLEGLRRIVAGGLRRSPITQVLLEESVLGWQEFELEVMRDTADNVVIICSIENVDPMGVHTGDSVTVAPALTLTDSQYQELRDAAKAVVRAIGVDTGGSNVQFAVHPGTGEVVVIEMNPRVSRSSALASKATGFPIAKIAAKLAVGYTLDEIDNDITKKTPACFEPTLDYVVVKVPRWAFEKFPMADPELTTHMKSVGEAMAIGRTFKEAFLKALRSRELDTPVELPTTAQETLKALAAPSCARYDLLLHAFRQGVAVAQLAELTGVSPFFLSELCDITGLEREVRDAGTLTPELLRRMKRYGFSDARLGELCGRTEREVRALRLEWGVTPVYKAVDTCAAEFAAETPYFYSTYEQENEAEPGERPRVVILGSGPNRIGQGIEFDYCCVHAALTARRLGYEAVMVNCNPETVSTDYDVSDRLYFEPLTFEDVANVCRNESPEGVIVQFGGQTPLKIAAALAEAGIPILGTPQASIDLAEDRGRFGELLKELGIQCPPYGLARTAAEARAVGDEIGYPLLVRPSYVLGGRAMEIVYSAAELEEYMTTAAAVSPGRPVLIDRFLEDAIEVDVDAVADGETVYVGAVMQHVEEAGVHSGDSACVIPSISLGEGTLEKVRRQTTQLALALGVKGLINVQFAYQNYQLYVLEVNPRASRTVPFVSKATGVSLAKVATEVALGRRLTDMDLPARAVPEHVSVKEVVLPFARFPGTDSRLGPEMKSTGEVMGIAEAFPAALAKAHSAAGAPLPLEGAVFLSVCDSDKSAATILGQRLHSLGFAILATRGTARALQSLGVPATEVNKVHEGEPHVVGLIQSGAVDLVVNTPYGRGARSDGYEIRTTAVQRGVPCITTLAGASAAVSAIEAARRPRVAVRCLQDLHGTA